MSEPNDLCTVCGAELADGECEACREVYEDEHQEDT